MEARDLFSQNVSQFLLARQSPLPCGHHDKTFCLIAAPGIDLPSYVVRIRKYLSFDGEDGETPVLGGLVLLERFLHGKICNRICQKSAHSTFFICVVLAHKFVFDNQISLDYLAKVGALPISQLLAMEKAMFLALGFDAGFDLESIHSIRDRISAELLHFDQDF